MAGGEFRDTTDQFAWGTGQSVITINAIKLHCIVGVKKKKTYDLCNAGSVNPKYFDDIPQTLLCLYV